MKILLLGNTGQVGWELQRCLHREGMILRLVGVIWLTSITLQILSLIAGMNR